MAEYTLVVRIPQAGNHEVTYSLKLSRLHESHPEDYFRKQEHRDQLCQFIQNQSRREVTTASLDAMISKWIADIRCGLYRTVVTLDLPPETYSNPEVATVYPQVTAPINPTAIPSSLTGRFTPKQPIRKPVSSVPPTTPAVPLPPLRKTSDSPPAKETDADSSNNESPPPPDIRTDTNRADF
ncbi:MAG: hypothetical protein F6J92_20205 [Symploca sp. SIO1A3]|nr:hypothetical protein [Symploca sp. SIO1A3]